MTNSLNPILNIGINRCDKLQIHHLRMVNLLTSLCVSGTLFFTALFWFAFDDASSALISCLFAVLYLINYVFTQKGMLWLAKYWVFLVFLFQQFYLPLFVLSDNFETELLLLVVPTTLVLVFDPSERIPRYGLSLIAIFLLFLAKTFPATDPILILTEANARTAYLCVILILVMLSVVLMDFYLIDLHSIDESSRKLIHDDFLTETANSQQLYKQVDALFFHAKRNDQLLSVIAINIDNFKQINEMHGRSTGDYLLQHVANLLKEHLPQNTPLGRLYADTFVVLMENSNAQKAIKMAEHLKMVINRSVVLLEHTAVKCTASLGVCTSNQQEIAGYSLIDNAIIAMLDVKKKGKNNVQLLHSKNINPHYHID